MIHEKLIDRLNAQAAHHLVANVRKGVAVRFLSLPDTALLQQTTAAKHANWSSLNHPLLASLSNVSGRMRG
jgi:hypothetical protein